MKRLFRFGGFASIALGLLAFLWGVAGPASCLLPIHSCLALGDEVAAVVSQGIVIAFGAVAIGTSLLSLSSHVSQRQET